MYIYIYIYIYIVFVFKILNECLFQSKILFFVVRLEELVCQLSCSCKISKSKNKKKNCSRIINFLYNI
jgi:hypothetical protein